MKKFAGSKLELYLLKSEKKRVERGICCLYEESRYPQTVEILESLHNKYAIRRVKKSVFYKPA